MDKHAYLIIAHKDFYVLEKTLSLLDDERNDIYIHIDKKINDVDFDHYKSICKKSKVYYPSKRINVKWGDQSLIITELLLYSTAFANGPYQYYHLLSGVDMPLKTQNEIHHFFSPCQCDFLSFKKKLTDCDIKRVSNYHFFINTQNLILRRLDAVLESLQHIFSIDRTKHFQFQVCKGGMVQFDTKRCCYFII